MSLSPAIISSMNWKKLKNERLWLGLLFVGGLIWILGAFFANLSFPDSSYNFLGSTEKAKLDSGKPISQKFIAKDNNLNQIKIIIGNSNLWPMEKIVFELADSSCESIIARETMTFLTPEPHIYYRFNFPEIADSQGKEYCFKATYFSTFDRGIERPFLGASEEEQFAGMSYFNEGNGRLYQDRTLQMRPSYGTRSFVGDLNQLNNRISQYKPVYLKGHALTAIFVTFLLGTLLLGWLLVFRKET